MDKLVRFGVSIDNELLEMFDLYINRKGYKNRSEAIRDLIRDNLIKNAIEKDEECYGAIILTFDHHVRGLSAKLTEYQHHFQGSIISNLHVHIDHDNCLEIIVVNGKRSILQELSDNLIGIKGVKHGKLVLTTMIDNE